jgi:hypothetical protein
LAVVVMGAAGTKTEAKRLLNLSGPSTMSRTSL